MIAIGEYKTWLHDTQMNLFGMLTLNMNPSVGLRAIILIRLFSTYLTFGELECM